MARYGSTDNRMRQGIKPCHTLVFILTVLCFSGACVDQRNGDCGEIEVPLQAVIDSRTKTKFDAGDRIGVFQVFYQDGEPGILGDIRYPRNVEYIYNGEYWSAAEGSEVYISSAVSDIYGYFPYDDELGRVAGKTDLTAYPVDLSGEQDFGQKDILWAKTERVTSAQNSALLVFRHVYTRFVVNLYYNDFDPGDPELKIFNTNTSTSVNMRNGEVASVNDGGIILPQVMVATEPGYDISYHAVIAPQQIEAGTPLFTMNNGEETVVYYLGNTIYFSAGRTYTFNLTFGQIIVGPETDLPVN